MSQKKKKKLLSHLVSPNNYHQNLPVYSLAALGLARVPLSFPLIII